MRITSENTGRELLMRFSGELDHHAARKAVAEITKQVDSILPRSLIIDMAELSFMDSSGIAVLLKAQRSMKELGGVMSVIGVSGQPRKVYEASGIDRLLEAAVR